MRTKSFEIQRTFYKISDIISWQRNGTLDLSPSFQRRPVWKKGAKSYLIDTIIRGLPIPIIFLREKKSDLKKLEPRREIVDGQQRIRTVISYIDPLLLKDFRPDRDEFKIMDTHNKELKNKGFNDLDDEYKQSILDYQFNFHILPSSIDDREILQIFARMNSTGLKLNDQELRNAEFFGEFKTSMYELAHEQLSRWREWKIFTEDTIARMEEVELTSELSMLMLNGISFKNQTAITRVYREKDDVFKDRYEIERRFRIVFDSIDDKLGSEMRFLEYRKKTLFYSLFAFFYNIHFGLKSTLKSVKPKYISTENITQIKNVDKKIKEKTAPKEVLEAAARRTTHLQSRKDIINYLIGTNVV